MFKKRVIILTLVAALLLVVSNPPALSQQTIDKGQLISDVVLPNNYKVYTLSDQVPKGCLFTIDFKVNEGGTSVSGVVALQRGTETVYQWSVGLGGIGMIMPLFMYYTVFITRSGTYYLNVTVQSWSEKLNYAFFYDFSDQLQVDNSKGIPLEGGIASYYVDLKSGDKASLNLTSPPGSDFDMQVFFGYSYLMLSPPVASTTYTSSSETLSFKAANEGRYFILITAASGNGTFNLKSSVTPQVPTYEELQSNYDVLNSSFQNLQTELSNVRNVMYALIAITGISVVTTLYLATRKRPAKIENKSQ